jgi:intracellular sulfur oxidation DsrE/DsrF family protein
MTTLRVPAVQPRPATSCCSRAMPWLAPLFLALLVAAAMPGKVCAHSDEGVVKVVYHADFSDPRRFSAMLTSINNMVTTYRNELVDYDIKIVFVAHGIRFVTDDNLQGTPFAEDPELAERRENLKGRLLSLNKVLGVDLELCNITRSQINLPEKALYEGVSLVTSGVVRIVELERDDYAYLKIE